MIAGNLKKKKHYTKTQHLIKLITSNNIDQLINSLIKTL